MEIHSSIDEAIGTLKLTGRLTVSDEPGSLKQAAADLVAQGAKSVILDLSHVPYIDSTRLGELIAAHVTVSRQGGRVVLAGATSHITNLLKVAGLEGIFESFTTVAEAHKALAR